MRGTIRMALATVTMGFAVAGVTALAGGSPAQPPLPHGCSVATLRGAYGFEWIGMRPVPAPPGTPPVTETFTGVALRTFDGEGNFTQISNVKGSVVGLEAADIESSGTYDVNEDCTGTATSQFVAGGPVVTARFVIVHGGDEIVQSVMTPAPLFNAHVLKKVRIR